jgi:biopolymer transport protein ExbD
VKTNYEHIVQVLDTCRQAGIWNVAFATSKAE